MALGKFLGRRTVGNTPVWLWTVVFGVALIGLLVLPLITAEGPKTRFESLKIAVPEELTTEQAQALAEYASQNIVSLKGARKLSERQIAIAIMAILVPILVTVEAWFGRQAPISALILWGMVLLCFGFPALEARWGEFIIGFRGGLSLTGALGLVAVTGWIIFQLVISGIFDLTPLAGYFSTLTLMGLALGTFGFWERLVGIGADTARTVFPLQITLALLQAGEEATFSVLVTAAAFLALLVMLAETLRKADVASLVLAGLAAIAYTYCRWFFGFGSLETIAIVGVMSLVVSTIMGALFEMGGQGWVMYRWPLLSIVLPYDTWLLLVVAFVFSTIVTGQV